MHCTVCCIQLLVYSVQLELGVQRAVSCVHCGDHPVQLGEHRVHRVVQSVDMRVGGGGAAQVQHTKRLYPIRGDEDG